MARQPSRTNTENESGGENKSTGDGDDIIGGSKGDDTLDGGAGSDYLLGGEGKDTFIHNFAQSGNITFDGGTNFGTDTIGDFNPDQDSIDFQGIDDITGLTVTALSGQTTIAAGDGTTLTFIGVSPDELIGANITLNGEAISSEDLQSLFGGAISDSTDGKLDEALGGTLDADAQQGGSPAGGAASETASLDTDADNSQADEAQDEEVVDV